MINTLIARRLYNPAISINLGNTSVQNVTDILQLFLRNFVNLAFAIAGIYAFFTLLRGGYEYITAGGDKEGISSARKRIMNALIGLALIFAIFAIITIFEILFNIQIRNFTIPTP